MRRKASPDYVMSHLLLADKRVLKVDDNVLVKAG